MGKKKRARSGAPERPASARARATSPGRTKPKLPKRRKPRTRSSPGALSPVLGGEAKRFAMFQVDAFTSRRFHGNPASVVLLDDGWLADEVMQAIAAENNLSETAFVTPRADKGTLGIRWFTPTTEVSLCGHATLASAHVLWNHVGLKGDRIVFSSKSGPLPVEKAGNLIVLDFPSMPAVRVGSHAALTAALGREPAELYKSRDLLAVFENKRDVHELRPDFDKLRSIDAYAVIVTAPGAGHDFVSRFFAPRQGVDEDPVTGSAHCTLTPYWARRLGKPMLTGHQVSRRGGEVFCEDRGSRVRLGGHAVTFFEGRISA